ncbi:hypothetical protein [Streptomyces sp. NPDC091212]|uniref:hypothetical protein n=1 Tax=Streptomyces sp. NPDC091212 TaxID=3155191 RepID=UPI003443EDAB
MTAVEVPDVKRLLVAVALASATGDEDGLAALIQGLEPELRDGLVWGLTTALVSVMDQACEARGAEEPRAMTLEALRIQALDVATE